VPGSVSAVEATGSCRINLQSRLAISEKFFGLVVVVQQFFDFRPELRIILANVDKKGPALGRVFDFERRLKNRIFTWLDNCHRFINNVSCANARPIRTGNRTGANQP